MRDRDLEAWLAQVHADPSVPACAFRIAYRLARSADQNGYVHVSQAELGGVLGRTYRTARKQLAALRDAGHLVVERHGCAVNAYQLVIKRREPRQHVVDHVGAAA
jgi:hypothetical protein